MSTDCTARPSAARTNTFPSSGLHPVIVADSTYLPAGTAGLEVAPTTGKVGDLSVGQLAHASEKVEEELQLLVVVIGEQLRPRAGDGAVELCDLPLSIRYGDDDDSPPVGEVGPPLHQPGAFQAVDHPGNASGREGSAGRELARRDRPGLLQDREAL